MRCNLFSACLLVLVACSQSKTVVPYQRSIFAAPAPVTQQLLATAVTEASTATFDQIGANLSSRRVCVEVNGVAPLGRDLFLDHLQGRAEGALAKRGALVVPCCVDVEVSDGSGNRVRRCFDKLDYRAVVGVGAGGIDYKVERTVSVSAVAGRIGAILGSLLVGIGPVFADDGAAAFSLPLGALGLVGSVVWTILDPPMDETVHLHGRVQLSVDLLPQSPGGTHASATGSGEEELVIPESAEAPYLLLED